MKRTNLATARVWMGASLLALSSAVCAPEVMGQAICAAAKLELGQEAALEREGFTARLSLTNNLGDLPLSDLRVDVLILDAEGQATTDRFFVAVTSLEGVAAVDGTGTVQPAGTAKASWLIVPTAGAGGTDPVGVRYTAQARMTFHTGGVPRVVTTFPVAITVKPQPLLQLEYVLPFEVFGDEPLTQVVESTQPFPLGLRVSNVGAGLAKKFTVESGQPKIVENEQSLAVDFSLLGTWVGSNALPENTFLINFGDIPPGGASLAAWSMVSSLSGRFTEFTSTFTHAAELGGALTSLIQSATTYTLVKDVLVDLPGRDAQFDFLVNVTTPREQLEADFRLGIEPRPEFLMESDRPGLTPIVEVPGQLVGTPSGTSSVLNYEFLSPVATGTWVHSSVPLASGASAPLVSVTRADGKVVNARNAWVSRHFDKDTLAYSYFLHVLDYTGEAPAAYAMSFDAAALDVPPSAIADLSASAAGHGSLDLSWTAAGEDGNEGAVFGGRYAIFVTTDPSVAPSVPAALINFTTSTNAGSSQSYRLTGLTGNATYYATVYAADAGGQYSAASNRAGARTGAYGPRAPAIIASPSSLEFAWLVAPDQPGAAYRLILSSAGGSVADTGYVVDAASVSFAGLSANTTYSLSAQARNADLFESSGSVVAEAVTWAYPPSALPFAEVNETSATARWAANGNPEGTVYRVELSTLAGGPAVADSGWVSASSETFQGLLPGAEYRGRVRARSHAGVETAAADLGAFTTVSVDTAPPSLTVIPPDGSTVTATRPAIVASYEDLVSGIDLASVRLAVDGVDVSTFAAVTASSAAFVPDWDLSQGTHTVTVQVADLAGNQSSATATFLVDSVAPVSVLLVNGLPAEASILVVITTDTVGFAAADAGAGVLETLYALDGSTTPLVYASTFSLTGGTYTISFFSRDLAGNAEEPKTAALSVFGPDVTAPVLALTPADASTTTSTTPLLVAAYADAERGVDPASVRLTLDGVDVTTQAAVTASSAAFTPTAELAQGTHTFSARAADAVGNEASAASTFLVDSLPPVTTVLVNGLPAGSTTVVVISTDSLGFAATDAGAGVQDTLYSLDGAAEAAFVSTFTLAVGPHSLTFYSRDSAGNAEAARSVALLARAEDATAPLARLDFPGASALGVEQSIGGVVDVRGVVSDASALTWILETAPGAAAVTGFTTIASGAGSLSGLIAAWDTAALSGSQTLRLRATDAHGNEAETTAAAFVGGPVFTFAVGRKDSNVIVSKLKNPTGIAVRSDGLIWVASADKDELILLTSSGGVVAVIEEGVRDFKNPQGLTVDAGDNLYIADKGNDRIVKLSPDGTQVLLQLGKIDKHGRAKGGSGPGELRRPWDAAVDVNGDIYVADSGNRRLQVFDSSGTFVRQFGQDVLLSTSEVRGIALTDEGLWVSDKELEIIHLFSRAGALIKTISGADSTVGELSRTRGLAADRFGALYVVEPNRDRAQKFDPRGKGLLAFGSKAGLSKPDKLAKRYLTMPIDAAVAPDGSIWLTDTGRDRVVRYALPVAGYGVAAYAAGEAGSSGVEPARRLVDHRDGARVERDDGAGVHVPGGALAEDLEITVDKGDENQDKEQKDAKRRDLKVSAASEEVQYGPEGTVFQAPVTLTLPYDAGLIASSGINEDELKVYYWNPTLQDWQAMPSVVDKENRTVSAQTTHFSGYQVQGPGGIGLAAAAIDEFGLRDGYAFPNPARGGSAVTFRIQPGLADSIEVRVYDLSGRKVHSSSDFRFRVLDDGNGKGNQNTYDHAWGVSGIGSGVYTFVITAKKAGRSDIRKTGKVGVIR